MSSLAVQTLVATRRQCEFTISGRICKPVSIVVSAENCHANSQRSHRTRVFCRLPVLYGGFVLLAAFSPDVMEATPLAGVNLAIWYGFGLIVAAIVLALVYGWVCRVGTPRSPSGRDTREGEL